MPRYGWVGLGVIVTAEALLFSRRDTIVGEWFTPIVWTGYVLLVDALCARLTGASLLTTERAQLVGIVVASIACWWLFEWYNAPRFWRGGADQVGLWWRYHRLEPNPFLRRAGYDWAFATIFPALFLTARVLRATLFTRTRVRPVRLPAWALRCSVAAGAVSVVLPLAVPSSWLAPLVWIGWVLLLEPVNHRWGAASWLRELEWGRPATVLALLASGLACGLLWEFWNYWALSKWTYTVPYWGDVKLFEMPVLGYLGFPPFALECFAMYNFLALVFRAGPPPLDPVGGWGSPE